MSFATWKYNVEVPIPDDWSNGFYEFVSLPHDGTVDWTAQDSAPFVVEDRSTPEPVCIVASYLTAAAYNTGFGASLYKGFDGRAYHPRLRASAVSMQRPQVSYYRHIEPVVQFLEGLDVPLRYATTLSVHKDPTILEGCRVIVLAYHPEYLSSRLRNALTEAIARGVHLLSFSANAFYWRAALHKDAFGHDIMLADKKAGDLWRNQGDAFSEQTIFGAQYPQGSWGGDNTPFVVEPRTHADAAPDPGLMSHWIFKNTGLRFGDRIDGLMGGEVDTFHPSYPTPDVQEQIVFLSPYYNKEGKEFMAHTSYFMRPSGQMTFHSASLRFQHALVSTNEPGWKIQRMIRNILRKMLNPDDGLISKSSNKDSHTFRYAKSHLHDGRIWSNRSDMFYFPTYMGEKVYALPTSLPYPDDVCRWVGCGATISNVYLVWFYEAETSRYEYGPRELATSLPGMQVEATLEDGIIFKISKDSCNNTEHLDKKTILETIGKDTRLLARSDFNVYQDKNDNRLVYVREECGGEDSRPRFFLHVFPVNRADLPAERRRFTYDNLDFCFDYHGFHDGARCVAVRDLPDYPIARIRTGQHVHGQGRLWESEVSLDQKSSRTMTRPQNSQREAP